MISSTGSKFDLFLRLFLILMRQADCAERCSTERALVESWSLGLGTVYLPSATDRSGISGLQEFSHVTEFQKSSYLQHPALLVC